MALWIGLYGVAMAMAALFYVFFMYLYLKYWEKLPIFEPLSPQFPFVKVSVLIPARNERHTLPRCLASILANDYPQEAFEIIVIDDFSDDGTPQYVRDLGLKNVKLVALADFGLPVKGVGFKKHAIECGLSQAAGTLIVTTDADCWVQPQWLSRLVGFYQKTGKAFIAAPVNFAEETNSLERFQSLDFLGMMGITGAGVAGRFTYMCNGANLAYEKSLFEKVGGFEGINHVASGDDMLLMQKVAHFYPDAIGFLKDGRATVFTTAKPDVQSFFNQRLRWASKSSSYTAFFTLFQLAVVFLFCVGITVGLLLGGLVSPWVVACALGAWVLKTAVDYVFLRRMACYFNRLDLMADFFQAQWKHVLYIVAVGFWANIQKKYVWKGRRVR